MAIEHGGYRLRSGQRQIRRCRRTIQPAPACEVVHIDRRHRYPVGGTTRHVQPVTDHLRLEVVPGVGRIGQAGPASGRRVVAVEPRYAGRFLIQVPPDQVHRALVYDGAGRAPCATVGNPPRRPEPVDRRVVGQDVGLGPLAPFGVVVSAQDKYLPIDYDRLKVVNIGKFGKQPRPAFRYRVEAHHGLAAVASQEVHAVVHGHHGAVLHRLGRIAGGSHGVPGTTLLGKEFVVG